MEFELHPSLARKTSLLDLPLCHVLLEDECHYPWLILVPRRPGLSRLMDLPFEDQGTLLQELDGVQRILWETFKPTQLNVAAIGNKTPQLHWHVIARYTGDPAWPGVVWDHPVRSKYSPEEKERVVALLRSAFEDVYRLRCV